MVKYNHGTPASNGILNKTFQLSELIENLEESSYYIADVAINEYNVIHRAILFTGFLNDKGEPSGYSKVINALYDKDYNLSEVYFINVLRKIDFMSDKLT